MKLSSLMTIAFLAAAPMFPARAAEDIAVRIAQAAPGATITVPVGVHRVNLVLAKPVTLIGAPGAVLDGGGHGDVVRVAADDVAVEHLTIRASGTDLTATNAGIFVERKARNVTLADNAITDTLFGIYLDGAQDVRITGNTVRGMRNLHVADRGDGIHLWNDAGCVVQGNDVAYSRDGIYIYVSNHNLIARNTVHHVRYGVHYMYSQDNRLVGNVSRDNLAGYALMASSRLTIEGNTAERDQTYGFLLNYISHSTLTDNTISGITGQSGVTGDEVDGGAGKGLFVYLSQFNAIHDNRVLDSQIGIHMTAGSEHNEVWGNSFIGNRVQVKYAQSLAQEWSKDGRGNYWSDYLGWDLDDNGIGDVPFRPNDGVDVLLWKYPAAKSLMSSPSILLMRYVQRAFPVFMPPAVVDSHPLMHAPALPRSPHG